MPLLQPNAAPPPDMPVQTKVTDEEIVVKQPSRLVKALKRIGLAIGLVLALAFAYLFLLLGEPDEDAKYTGKVQQETISAPMSAYEVPGDSRPENLAELFGHPVLSLAGGLAMQKARVYDTAFESGYARRVTITYAFQDGQVLTVESLRPTSAVTMLGQAGYSLDASALYTLGGLNAARAENEISICVFGQSEEAVYAVICPTTHADELDSLLHYTMLTAPSISN